MIVDTLDGKNSIEELIEDNVWKEAFIWLEQVSPEIKEGTYEINDQVKAIIKISQTEPREKGFYEVHKNVIDIHYCLNEELIDWVPASLLVPSNEYDSQNDYQLFKLSPKASTIHLIKNSFAIFFPGEAHLPKIAIGETRPLKKVVVKINK